VALLLPALEPSPRTWRLPLSAGKRAIAASVIAICFAAAAARSTAQLYAGHLYAVHGDDSTALKRAVRIDPGEYRLWMLMGEQSAEAGDCRRAVAYAQRARALYPTARAPQMLLRRCALAPRTRATVATPPFGWRWREVQLPQEGHDFHGIDSWARVFAAAVTLTCRRKREAVAAHIVTCCAASPAFREVGAGAAWRPASTR